MNVTSKTKRPTVAARSEAEIRSEAILAERVRINAILNGPEGKKRPNVAKELALTTNMTSAQVANILQKMPVESPFLEAMSIEGPVGVASAFADARNLSPGGDAKASRAEEIAKTAAGYAVARGYISPEQAAAKGVNVRA
ncbi:hypothetical protein M2323_002743 [Rhodoblastus acidophilus]|uniref:hypothetical protein n=1 Tax=Rhodoblastus acidophilus TaxID=1074 RepID=UPI0022256A7F|nr:hypothetical protein [Rhodoblastus acidophilus]MCW2284903.1 hypothetical protein [Rhodoblastus acidophilus]MCW2333807.1 hypothetical protein [Rhodoblastus acidophilus]